MGWLARLIGREKRVTLSSDSVDTRDGEEDISNQQLLDQNIGLYNRATLDEVIRLALAPT